MITITEKQENSEVSPEYLKAFHKFVTGHPLIYDQVKAEIHKRARGSAGGQAKARKAQEEDIELEDIEEHLLAGEGPLKVTNAAHVEGEILETDEYFDVPTVFAKEGVFVGTNGIPTLKRYDVLKANAPRFLGVPITDKHLETDTLRPDDRWLGHAISATPRDDKRDIFGISRYYKKYLLPDEIGKIQNKQFPDASPGYFTITKRETGEFEGNKYDAVELGPYNVVEYANFFSGTKGACSREMGCGPFQNASPEPDPFEELMKAPSSHVLVDGRFVKRCPKQTNEADKMEEIEALRADYEKQLNAANEKVTSLEGIVSELSAKLDGLATEHKQLNEAFTSKATAEAAASESAHKEAFKKQLNAAAATEIDTLWGEVRDMNPATYEAWKITNSAKLLTEAEAKTLAGKKTLNSADVVEAARAKADATLFKRR